jgi:hypothetical protein
MRAIEHQIATVNFSFIKPITIASISILSLQVSGLINKLKLKSYFSFQKEDTIQHIDFNVLMEVLKVKSTTADLSATNLEETRMHQRNKNENFTVEVSYRCDR